jgi:hypothetical protein
VIRLLVALAGVLALAGCGGTETVTVTESRTETETETVAETTTVTEATSVGLPEPVAETHAALLAAAESGDYEQLRRFLPDEFSYTFGTPVEGGPIAYWQQVEAESGESPIDRLAEVLRLPYTLYAGTYVWPFAYDKQRNELTGYERRLLGDLAVYSGAGSGYLGWRAGIDPDGTWRFFIAGD